MERASEATGDYDGEQYAKASAHQEEWGLRMIAELPLKGTERVLDLGCGDGRLTVRLAQRVPDGNVLGIDSSPGMLAAARKHLAPNLRFECLDINAMTFREEFDVVFSNAALQWVKDHVRLLGNAYRALRQGGYLRVQFAGEGTCSCFTRVVREAIGRPELQPDFARFEWPWFMPGTEEYRVLVAKTPFKAPRIWGENADRSFPDADAITRWIDQPVIVPFLRCVADEKKRAFRDFVLRRMLEETRQPDGRYFETFRRVNVSAHK